MEKSYLIFGQARYPPLQLVHYRKLARILKNCGEYPGSELFQYLDEQGQRHGIDSGDVNNYLREISGREITAKDFRTWAATNLAALALSVLDEDKPSKKGTLQVVKEVATQLGNTPTVCRRCYIHPAVFEGHLAGSPAGHRDHGGPRRIPDRCMGA